MQLGLSQREQLTSLSSPLVDELDNLNARITSGWNVDHKPDGSHGAIHADSLTIPDDGFIGLGFARVTVSDDVVGDTFTGINLFFYSADPADVSAPIGMVNLWATGDLVAHYPEGATWGTETGYVEVGNTGFAGQNGPGVKMGGTKGWVIFNTDSTESPTRPELRISDTDDPGGIGDFLLHVWYDDSGSLTGIAQYYLAPSDVAAASVGVALGQPGGTGGGSFSELWVGLINAGGPITSTDTGDWIDNQSTLNGDNRIRIGNASSGTAASTRLMLGNNNDANAASLSMHSSGFTTSGARIASRLLLRNTRSGGVCIESTDSTASVAINTNSVERLAIDTLVIGTAIPIYFPELSSSPSTAISNLSSGAGILQYHRGDKIVFAFNDGGTVRYKYLDMTGTGVTWTHSTGAP